MPSGIQDYVLIVYDTGVELYVYRSLFFINQKDFYRHSRWNSATIFISRKIITNTSEALLDDNVRAGILILQELQRNTGKQ